MSDETPTERFEAPGPPGSVPAPATPSVSPDAPHSRQRLLTMILAVIGVVLLVVIAVLVTILIMNGQRETGTPVPQTDPSSSASPDTDASEPPQDTPGPAEPSDEPSPPASAAPPPPPPPPATTGPVFNSFAPANNNSVGCSGDTGSVAVTFTWSSTGANEAAIGVGVGDAYAGPYETGLPPSGSYTLDYQCGNASQIYTVSIRGASGQTNKTVTLRR